MRTLKKQLKEVVIFNGKEISKYDAHKALVELKKDNNDYLCLWVKKFDKTLDETLQGGIVSIGLDKLKEAIKNYENQNL